MIMECTSTHPAGSLMPESDEFWDFYWEVRLQPLENLGKRAAILAASKLIRQMALELERPLRLLELGCGEGQVIGALLDAHSSICSIPTSLAVDYNTRSLARCQRDIPGLPCLEGDFTSPDLLAGSGQFDLVLLVNALHEVFSDQFSAELGEIDVPSAKLGVEEALAAAVRRLHPGGWLVLFDGLEPSADPRQLLRVRFRDPHALAEFEQFALEYRSFRIAYRKLADYLCVELSLRDFTRYLTKSIFVGKRLWETERKQSYQYFTEAEFRAAFARQDLEIDDLRGLTINEDKWRTKVEIETPGVNFPEEHILILARKPASG